MIIRRVEEMISEIGHPRGHLIKSSNSNEIDLHRRKLGGRELQINSKNKDELEQGLRVLTPNNYYIVTGLEETTEALVRAKTIPEYKFVDSYSRRHIVGSSIRNIIIEPSDIKSIADKVDDDPDAIRINTMMYLYYYFCLFSMWIPDENKKIEKTIIEGVCLLVQETISTLIAKGGTLYEGHNIDPYIDLLQMRLRLERLSLDSGNERVFNLREFL